MKYLVIGNGVAGTTAAINIRRFDPDGEVTIITEEDLPFYSRIRLPEYLSGAIDAKKLAVHSDLWYEQNRITLITNKRVSMIDHSLKQVLLEGNARMTYDKLLVATGSRAVVPSIAGVHKQGVFTLRTIADARKIRVYAEGIASAVILGGGVLGLEIGNALRNIGKSVTFVEYFPRLLPKQMDIEGSLILREKLENFGLRFVLDARAEEVLGNNSVEGLQLMDGSSVRGRMLIISAGVSPEKTLFANTGIALGRGVPVNERMETELPDVYAAGDAAEFGKMVYGTWSAAEKQGESAGINMAGGNTTFNGMTPSHSITVAGIEVISAGEIDVDRRLPSLVYKDKDKGVYKKVVIENDCVAGCILCGDLSGKKELISAVKQRRPIQDMQGMLEGLNLTWMQ